MRSAFYWGDDSNVFAERIKGGAPQHAILMYDMEDIIDNSRIYVDNGFTMNEIFNADNNVTPGNVCSSNIDFNLMNEDGALDGFIYNRKFMFLLGVDYQTDIIVPKPVMSATAFYDAYNISVYLSADGNLRYKGSHDSYAQVISGKNYVCMTVWQSTEEGNPVYIKMYRDLTEGAFDSYSCTVEVYKIVNGDGHASGQFYTYRSNVELTLSKYAYKRLVDMSENKWWDIYLFNDYGVGRIRRRGAGIVCRETKTMLSAINVFYGRTPSKVTGKNINYNAVDVFVNNDKDATSYLTAEWSSSKTLPQVYQEIATAMGEMSIDAQSTGSWTSLDNIVYTENPFIGLAGYTYRDLLGLIAESIGMSVTVWRVLIQASGTGVQFNPYVYFRAFTDVQKWVHRDEYYSYDFDESLVSDITHIIVKQTADDIGVKYPADATSDTKDAVFIVDNPLLRYDTEASIQNRASYIWQRMVYRAGGYYPGAVEMFSPILLQPGDVFGMTGETEDFDRVFAFAITTNWNGMAECTIESTGDTHRNQETSVEYKKTIRQGSKFHEFDVDLETLRSSIGEVDGRVNTLSQTVDETVSEIRGVNGRVNTLSQTVDKTVSEIRGVNSPQILRGTAMLQNAQPASVAGSGDWDKDSWATQEWTSSGLVSVINVTGMPVGKGFSLSGNGGNVQQRNIPLDAGTYTLSCYARIMSGNRPLGLEIGNGGSVYVSLTDSWQRYSCTYTLSQSVNDGYVQLKTYGNNDQAEVQICGMKLEAGSTATDWSEADSYAFSRIQQTAESIDTKISTALGDYYTKTETAQQISTSIGTALGDYYTKTETAQQISTSIGTALGDYYTKTETAQQISTSIGTALGDYYTKTETAQQISTSIGTALGNYYTKTETAQMYAREIASITSAQILRGTNVISPLEARFTPNADWAHSKWVRTGAASKYAVNTLSNPPSPGIKKSVSITSDSSSDVMIIQPDVPVDPGTSYTLSCYVRPTSGSQLNAILTLGTSQDFTVIGSGWTKIKLTYNNTSATTLTPELGVPRRNSQSTIEICGMKLEVGTEATDWTEADSYTFSRIQQTADSISTQISSALGDYYTKTETATQISTSLNTALGNYYTKTETATQISTSIGTALGDYYTKTETAQQISTSIGNALGDYYTKTETAQQISTSISSSLGNYYTKTETAQQISTSMSTALGNYYTKTETATQISTSLSTALGNYYTKTETASQISTSIGNALGDYYTKTETAQQITTSISSALGNYSTTQQTAQQISAYVSSHAYGLVSGISITAAGVDITGSKYVNIQSGNSYVKLGAASAGSTSLELALSSSGGIYLTPNGGQNGWVQIDCGFEMTGYGNLNLFPQAMVGQGGDIWRYDSTLGAPGADERWTSGYIDNLYYYNAYEQSSRDEKHDIQDLPEFGSLIDQLRPVSFVYNSDQTEKKRFGLIHEETVELIPEVCKGDMYSDSNKKAINYIELVPVLLKEIQSLRRRVAELESKN